MKVAEDKLDSPEIVSLLEEHLAEAYRQSPPESVHTLDLEALKAPDITFWSCREGTELMGCGALKQLGPEHGEIKSMRTANEHLRKGVASKILEHIIEVAKQRSYIRLSLETGSMDGYVAAQKLYLRYGFEFCGPFGDYKEDPNSKFMTLSIDQ